MVSWSALSSSAEVLACGAAALPFLLLPSVCWHIVVRFVYLVLGRCFFFVLVRKYFRPFFTPATLQCWRWVLRIGRIKLNQVYELTNYINYAN